VSYATGIDVSHYQSTTPSLAGLAFLIARSSIGLYADELYPMHVANAKRAGLEVGAYHFGYRSRPIIDQARIFAARSAGVRFRFLDREGDEAPTHEQARAFVAEVRRLTGSCGQYMSESVYDPVGEDYTWVAHYGVIAPRRPWTFHQYRGTPLDLDRYHGTVAELRAWVAALPSHAPEVPMQSFTILPGPPGSLVTKATPGIAYLRLADGSLNPVPAGYPKAWAQPIKLLKPIPGGVAGADRQTGYLVGDEAAVFLASDVIFTPAATTADLERQIAAAKAALGCKP
jgi:hypothetical protein